MPSTARILQNFLQIPHSPTYELVMHCIEVNILQKWESKERDFLEQIASSVNTEDLEHLKFFMKLNQMH